MAAGTANRRSYAVCAWLRLVATLATMLACAQPYARSDAEVAAVETVVPPGAEAGATGGETAGSDAPPKAPAKDPLRGRFLPVPVFITEPAIGTGLGVALTYFHSLRGKQAPKPLESAESAMDLEEGHEPPPTVTAVFGAYTDNDTHAFGVAHSNTFRQDSIRYVGAAGALDLVSSVYLLDLPISFNLRGKLLHQDVRFRIGGSDVFWGLGLTYLDADNRFRLGSTGEALPPEFLRAEFDNVAAFGRLTYDRRDSTLMPGSGQLVDLKVARYDEALGSDFEYNAITLKALSFHPLRERFVLGFRLAVEAVGGNPPFFGFPWVKLRGIPAMRYQGERVAVAELEGRFDLAPRWAAVAFAGGGWTHSDIPQLDTEETIRSFGAGLRYKVFEPQNVWVGVDVARGPEETNWYIQVGHPW